MARRYGARLGWSRGILAVVAGAVLLAGCSDGSTDGGGGDAGGGGGLNAQPAPEATIDVAPADQTADVSPADPVVVTAADGTLSTVTVTGPGGAGVEGEIGDDKAWHSTAKLDFDTRYTVKAVAENADGEQATSTTSFSTVAPAGLGYDAVAPLQGEALGVGIPFRVYFHNDADDSPLSVADKDMDEVLKHLTVTSDPQQEGGWHWFAGDTEAHFRPKEYWQAGTTVTIDVDLKGVELADGVYGKRDRQLTFTIGDKHVSVADTANHRLQVYKNDQLVQDFPASMGKEVEGRYTHNGVHIVTDKNRSMTMDSTTFGLALDAGGYQTEVEFATRISNNGEFVHSAPWSVNQQGTENVSHGCVNLSPSRAEWFFNFSQLGDVVEVTGSPVPLTPQDGDIYDWTIPWDQWIAVG